MTDTLIYGWRYLTLMGILSCLAFMDESNKILDDDSRSKLNQWLLERDIDAYLWGEGAVSNIVPWLLWLRKHDPTLRPDLEIANLTETVISLNQHKSKSALANPYYSFEEIARFRMRIDKSGEVNVVDSERFDGSAFTAEALYHLLVRTNLKQKCKILWPNFTKITHRVSIPDYAWEYSTIYFESGVDQSKIYPSTYKWDDLQAEATEIDDSIPVELVNRPWLLALWWQIAPYRYTTAASRVFVEGVLPGWGKWGNLVNMDIS